ncbi:MAG TPA: hypothetical protein VMW70_05250 [Burkholderiales bacterium]|nr:hypothetical protein [Burkholderiales bacterium]
MFRHRLCLLQIFAALFLLGSFSLAPRPSLAQDGEMTFEHAQTRTAYARRQMESMRRELKDAEAREESALRELDDLKKRIEQAQQNAENATQARQSAEEKFSLARQRWSEESERLKRIHQNRDNPATAR